MPEEFITRVLESSPTRVEPGKGKKAAKLRQVDIGEEEMETVARRVEIPEPGRTSRRGREARYQPQTSRGQEVGKTREDAPWAETSEERSYRRRCRRMTHRHGRRFGY